MASSRSEKRSLDPWEERGLNQPVTSMVASGQGYMMVAADGGVFNFGNDFFGSLRPTARQSNPRRCARASTAMACRTATGCSTAQEAFTPSARPGCRSRTAVGFDSATGNWAVPPLVRNGPKLPNLHRVNDRPGSTP